MWQRVLVEIIIKESAAQMWMWWWKETLLRSKWICTSVKERAKKRRNPNPAADRPLDSVLKQ